jgi:hypothetical protein
MLPAADLLADAKTRKHEKCAVMPATLANIAG